MTQVFNHIPEQSSRFNQFVIGAFMSTMIVLGRTSGLRALQPDLRALKLSG